MYHVLLPVDGDEDRLDKQLETLTTLPGDDEITVTRAAAADTSSRI
ncbi:hypothetical protein [Halohasta litorea]|uniref:Glycosyl transferase family 2 n=1 Tax=Halohasta litorea TaxID=869891 RepID=A0ABD6D9J7_9EURY|nr:hypothetical protein [Halohasta litorea]